MKKVLMILLALAMVFSMAGVVSADGTEEVIPELDSIPEDTQEIELPDGTSSGMELNYEVDSGYILFIPSDVSFNENLESIGEVKLSNVFLPSKGMLTVTVKSPNDFNLQTGTDLVISKIPYSVTRDDGTDVTNSDSVVLEVSEGVSENAEKLTFSTTQEDIDGAILSGKHTDTLSFYVEPSINEKTDVITIGSFDQLMAFAESINNGNNYKGMTIELTADINLEKYDADGERVSFTPIGGVDKNVAFEGTFDGKGHTISNLYQSGWDLGYEYGQTAGIGLFGWVGDATIKNLRLDNAEITMEAVVMGIVAGYAAGDCVFENITVSNSQIANYNWDTGGIVGQVYGQGSTFTFKNINIDDSTTISGHWGTWDVSAGGVIGRTADGVKVIMKDVTVAAKLDVYNDVCAAYQWYAYRYSGMLVGYTKTTEEVDGRTVATAPHITCENVTVIYNDWANYTYCQASNVAPQYVRVQGGYSTDPYYSGRHWTAGVDANGNKMVDDNHVHAEGEAHNELIVFDQLFGGGQGVYGTATHPGVTVIYNNK